MSASSRIGSYPDRLFCLFLTSWPRIARQSSHEIPPIIPLPLGHDYTRTMTPCSAIRTQPRTDEARLSVPFANRTNCRLFLWLELTDFQSSKGSGAEFAHLEGLQTLLLVSHGRGRWKYQASMT